jgi:phage tail-like protein
VTQVVAVQARELQRVRVSFDQAVKQADPSAANDALNPGLYTTMRQSAPAVDVIAVGVESVSPSAVDLVFDIPLTPLAQYRLGVGAIADLNGGTVAPGSGMVFTGFVLPRPADRDFTLWFLLPEANRREDDTGDLRRFLDCLDEVASLLLADIDGFTDILDPDVAPERFLDLMLAELGNPFPFDLSVIDKRRLINVLVDIYQQKGTAIGIKNAVRFFLGIEIDISAYAEICLSLGESLLGVDWILGSSQSADRHSFEVTAPRLLQAEERARIRAITDYMKPAHTHFRALFEPTPPVVIDHVELGLSELGDTWLLH